MTSQVPGDPLPDFVLSALTGESVSLASIIDDKRGAVIVFWSGVCSHCQRYDTYLSRFAGRFPDLGLAVIASRQDESADDLSRILTTRRLTVPILHDRDRSIAHQWLVQQTPRAFLVDNERRLTYRGAIDNFKYPNDPDHRHYLEDAIADFLAGRKVQRQETASFGCPIESIYYDLPKP